MGNPTTNAKTVSPNKGTSGNVNKVGGSTPKAAAPEKEKKVKRIDFPIEKGVKLTVPMPEGFNLEKHNRIKKVNFEKGGIYLQHCAAINRIQIERLTAQAKDWDSKADRMLRLGDDKTAKKVKKIERLQGTLANLKKELEESGVDISEILNAIASAAPAVAK
jgi:hypothetical protein